MKSPEAFRTISEVASELDVPQHVLRFWETKFSQIKPLKRGGGRRYYRPEDLDLLRGIRALLYTDGMTIKGVQKVIREQGVRTVVERSRGGTPLLRAASRPKPVPSEGAAGVVSLASDHAAQGSHEALQVVLAALLEAKTLLGQRRAGRTTQAPAIRRQLA